MKEILLGLRIACAAPSETMIQYGECLYYNETSGPAFCKAYFTAWDGKQCFLVEWQDECLEPFTIIQGGCDE